MNASLKAFSSPETQQNTGTRRRQAARIIKHLRQELAHEHPLLTLPTGWMIDNLVSNCPKALFDRDDWPSVVMALMSYIATKTSSETPSPVGFYQSDGQTPLFPNHELYDDYDAHRFCMALHEHMKNQT